MLYKEIGKSGDGDMGSIAKAFSGGITPPPTLLQSSFLAVKAHFPIRIGVVALNSDIFTVYKLGGVSFFYGNFKPPVLPSA